MAKPDYPITMGVRFLREHEVPFVAHLYRWTGGGAIGSARTLGVDPLRVAKTLIFENQKAEPLTIIMNGPYEVGVGKLARHVGTKSIAPCAVARAEALTGYRVGGISPFGQKTKMPAYIQLDLFEYDTILVNGGKRGFLVEVSPGAVERVLAAEIVDVAVE